MKFPYDPNQIEWRSKNSLVEINTMYIVYVCMFINNTCTRVFQTENNKRERIGKNPFVNPCRGGERERE